VRVLVVEDYSPVRDAVAQGLREAGFAAATAGGTTSASVSNRTFTLRLTLKADAGTPESAPAS
jgi:DNA-binding response OmpR family regulator